METPPREQTLSDVFKKRQPLTREDLQQIRERSNAAAQVSNRADSVLLRMQVEQIDSAVALDDSIRALNTATTRLMCVAIVVAVVGVIVSAAQIIAALLLQR